MLTEEQKAIGYSEENRDGRILNQPDDYSGMIGKESADKTGYPYSTPILSSESAANAVQGNLAKLNGYSPTTSPGYTPPAAEEKTPEVQKMAKFVNDAGQIVSFSEEALKNDRNRETLAKGGYVFSEGDYIPDSDYAGHSYRGQKGQYYNSVTGERDLNAELDAKLKEFDNYNVDTDPEFQSRAREIRNNYQALKDQMKVTNESRMKAYEALGMRTGTSEFAGGLQMGIEGEELTQGNRRLTEITNQENEAIAAARSAYQSGKWSVFNKQIDIIDERRKEKAEALKKYNETLAEANKKAKSQEIQSSRDSAIAGLLQQGITDPVQMFNYLNYNDSGQKVGDFTLDDVFSTLESVSKYSNSNIEKLTGDTKNFFLLKNMQGALPKSITSLPEGQQLGAYIQWNKQLEKGETVTPTGKLTTINANPSADEIDKLPVSQLTKAIMTGFGKVKDLTPTDKAKVLQEMYQVGYNPQTYVMNKLSNLVQLYSSIPDNSRGYLEGAKWWESKTNPTVAAFESARTVLTREIARLNDVGVLSDQDVASYTDSMPSRRDSGLDVILNKISGLQSSIVQKKAENVGKLITITAGPHKGKQAIVSFDGDTLLDPATGKELE